MLAEGSLRYSLPQPLEQAIESICSSLRNQGMRVAGQLDVSHRIERSLGMILTPCRIVFVLPGSTTLTAEAIHPWAAVFLPLHIVISGNDCQSEIQIPNRVQMVRGAVPLTVYSPVVEVQRQTLKAIEAIAVRSSILA
jgi:uncharacterized protein (DUF302 family)